MRNLLSIDVEDWFHIMDIEHAPPVETWSSLEPRVERSLRLLLDDLSAAGTHATFFFLGWVAERYPHLVREVHDLGHEVACHGNDHELVYRQTPERFAADIGAAKARLEDLTGSPVLGYRAPGFSIVPSTPWALELVAAAGFRYDSSIFPAARGHGGMPGAELAPHTVSTPAGDLHEIPVTVTEVLGRRICLFGGGYFRLFPYRAIARMAAKVNAEGRPVLYYLHPREVDPGHPKLPMGALRHVKSYVNVGGTRAKLRRLLRDQPLGPLRGCLPA